MKPGHKGQLTAQESRVVRLLARGYSTAQIAERLFLSPPTVHHHLDHIYEKLGLHTRVAATRWYLRQVDADSENGQNGPSTPTEDGVNLMPP